MNATQWRLHRGECPTDVLREINPLVVLEPGTRRLIIANEWFGRKTDWYGNAFGKHTIRYALFFSHRKLQYLDLEEERIKSVVESVPQWNQHNIDLDPEKDKKISAWIQTLHKFHQSFVHHINNAGEAEIKRRAIQCNVLQDTNNQHFTNVRALMQDCCHGTTRQRLFREDPNQFFALVHYLFFALTNAEGDAWLQPAITEFFEQEMISMSNVNITSAITHSAFTLAKWHHRHYGEDFNSYLHMYQQTKLRLYKQSAPKNVYQVEMDIPLLGGRFNPANLTVGTKRVYIEVSNLRKSPAFVNMISGSARIARLVNDDGQPNLTRDEFLRIAGACYDDPDLKSCSNDISVLLTMSAQEYAQSIKAQETIQAAQQNRTIPVAQPALAYSNSGTTNQVIPPTIPDLPRPEMVGSSPIRQTTALEHRALNSPGLLQQLNETGNYFDVEPESINNDINAAADGPNDGVCGSADNANNDAAVPPTQFEGDAITEATCATTKTAVSSLTNSVVEKSNNPPAAAAMPPISSGHILPPLPPGIPPHMQQHMMHMLQMMATGILICVAAFVNFYHSLTCWFIVVAGNFPSLPNPNMSYYPYFGMPQPHTQQHNNANSNLGHHPPPGMPILLLVTILLLVIVANNDSIFVVFLGDNGLEPSAVCIFVNSMKLLRVIFCN